jgi:hypothetical protein
MDIQIKGWRLMGAKALILKALMCAIARRGVHDVYALSRVPKGWS